MQTVNNLKELTREQHKNAERSIFIKKLLKKEITPYEYYVYLCNQFLMYNLLEVCALSSGVLKGIEELIRSDAMSKDILELEVEYNFKNSPLLKSTFNYMRHIHSISNDTEKLLSHVYVRHMGDLSGGQVIKRFVPGSGEHYKFETNVDLLKERVREKLHDGLAEESKVCFNMIKEFMEELESSLDMAKTD